MLPLEGLRVVELAGLGPGPFAGMMLADHGTEVIRIERPAPPSTYLDPVNRSRRSIIIDLKQPDGVEAVIALCATADGFIEGLRPGVTERLGLGPDVLLARNPRLVYGRVTGWGQSGPLANSAGHDINYIALAGALYAIGQPDQKPPVPLNLIGDYGGGGLLLAFGMLSAILAAQRTGKGQVVDAAMTDGAALLMANFHGTGGESDWHAPRGTGLLTGAAPFYDTYETRDGGFIALGAIEPQFHTLFLELVGLSGDALFSRQMDKATWPAAKARLAALFSTRTRDEWCALLEGTDACFAPVLSLQEAQSHPHNLARGTFVEAFGLSQPAPAPRYSVSETRWPEITEKGAEGRNLLGEAGYSSDAIDALVQAGTIRLR